MIIKNLVDMTNTTLVNAFTNAITWEKCDMLLTLNAEATKKQENIISNNDSTATADEIKVAQAKLEKLRSECAEIKKQQENVTEDYTTVVNTITSTSNEYTTNDKIAIRNILRLSSCDDNSKFFKLAIITDDIKFESFYNDMVSLHDMDSDEVMTCGLRRYAGASEEKATKLSADIQGLIKKMFTVSIENKYTKKINVKFNKTDMNCVHESFVTGLSVDIKNSKKSGKTVEGVSFRYAIEKVEKKGQIEYKGVRFKETLAKLAFNKLFA